MRIGILAVQGAFAEHAHMVRNLGHEVKEIRQKQDLSGLDRVILPGGESTVQGQLLEKLDMLEELKGMIRHGLPVLATCAGLILLAERIENDDVFYLGTLPVTVRRNAFGRQIASFVRTSSVRGIGEFPMTFIRAPYVVSAGDSVEVLAEIDGKIVAVRWKNQVGLAFHPELSGDTRIHEYFMSI